jgi:hypothetical protein
MLIDGRTETVRLQCRNCGAHALMGDSDYTELIAHSQGEMRCEVCGYFAEFARTEPPARERWSLAAR